jgi:hypothetical protein
MLKAAILIVGALTSAACAERAKEPETPKQPDAREPQMAPASGDEPIEREYPPPPPPVINDQDDNEGLDYDTPPSDPGEYRDNPEAPPP